MDVGVIIDGGIAALEGSWSIVIIDVGVSPRSRALRYCSSAHRGLHYLRHDHILRRDLRHMLDVLVGDLLWHIGGFLLELDLRQIDDLLKLLADLLNVDDVLDIARGIANVIAVVVRPHGG